MTAVTIPQTMALDDITVVDGANSRRTVDVDDGLADSIRLVGILTPLTVDQDGRLLAGHRRLAAARAAELQHVPVTVVTTTEQVTAEAVAGVENIARRQLTAAEEADAVGRMLANGYTPEGSAQALDMPLARVRRRQQLLELPEQLRALWGPGGGAPPSAVPAIAELVAKIPTLADAIVTAEQLLANPPKPRRGQNRYNQATPPSIQHAASDPMHYLQLLDRAMRPGGYGHVKGMPDPGDFILAADWHRITPDSDVVADDQRQPLEAKLRAARIAGYYDDPKLNAADMDAARAAGVTLDTDDGAGEMRTVVISHSWLTQRITDEVLPRYHKAADRAIAKSSKGGAKAARDRQAAGETLSEAEQKRLDADAKRKRDEKRWRDEARGSNLDLGRALLTNLAAVEVTADVARLFAEASLGRRTGVQDYNPYATETHATRLAAAGLRLVMADWQTERATPTKANPEKVTIDYLPVEECAARLWAWFDRADTPGEIFGRALIIHAAARWAVENALPQSKRMMTGHGGYGARTVLPATSAKLLEKIVKPTVPASTMKLIRSIQRGSR